MRDRVKEAVFSSVAGLLAGADVLDLYAGSGALAIEALSRGAAHALLVEREHDALAAIRANLETTGLAAQATVLEMDVAEFVAQPRGGPFGLVFADPPFAVALSTVLAQLGQLCELGALEPEAWIVLQRERRDPELATARGAGEAGAGGLALVRERSYGDSAVLHLQVQARGGEGATRGTRR